MLSELDNYLQRIEDLRRQVSDLIAGLPVEALDWRPIEGNKSRCYRTQQRIENQTNGRTGEIRCILHSL